MPATAFGDVVARQDWLRRLGDVLAPAVGKAFAAAGDNGRRVKDALNGVWLGHALHPVLTDIPIGAWTTAWVLEAASLQTGRKDLEDAADLAVAAGLVGAVGAAVTGLTDWSDTDGASRRIGLLHGLLNLTATGLYAAGLVLGRRQRRGTARGLSLGGYLIASVSAYLGGDLVYRNQIGVNHAAGLEVPEEFTPALREIELKDGQMKRAMVGATPVLLVRNGSRVRALAETCAHMGGPLSEGTLEGDSVVCPWHASRFSLEDGSVLNGPATVPQPRYEARIRNGQVEVRMPREPVAEETAGAARAAK